MYCARRNRRAFFYGTTQDICADINYIRIFRDGIALLKRETPQG